MNDAAVILLPLLGVIVGASLQFIFGRAAQRRADLDTQRALAYTDYLRAVAAAAHLRSDEDLRDAHRDAADAKARIAVFGSSTAVSALARFEREGAILSTSEGIAAFVSLVETMRSEHVDRSELELLLVGPSRE